MANNLGAYVTKFTTRLDKVIERECLTNDLNMNGDLLGELSGAGEIKVAKMAMDGLGDYSRTSGFVQGAVTTDWETMQLRYDRGREFVIDSIDDEERDAIVSANVMAEFERTKVVPEVDAVRFAVLAEKAGTVESGALTTADGALDAVLAAEQAIEDEGADLAQCILYCTSAVKGLLRKAQNYRIGQGEEPNGRFKSFDDMKIVTVPANRFYDAIDLYDGTSADETAGGYVKHAATTTPEPTAAGVGLNFMIVHPSACSAIQKHKKLRYFAPDTNQDADAHKWQVRLFHDLLVYDNRAGLIYCHKATA